MGDKPSVQPSNMLHTAPTADPNRPSLPIDLSVRASQPYHQDKLSQSPTHPPDMATNTPINVKGNSGHC
jgi:hypothetical protein